MENATNTPHRIDDYLQRIEERERAARKKKMMLGGIGILSIVAIGGLYLILNINKDLRKYSIQELSKEIVTEIFDDDDTEIVVAHALGTDTIRNLNEYQSLVDLFEGSDIQPAFYQRNDPNSDGFEEADDAPEEILQKFSIDVSGNREEGNSLIFTIEDYDPDVEYTLSFGTGYKRKVGRVSRYTYKGYGTYRLRLLASSSDRGSSIYTKSIRINRAKRETNPSPREREVIAEGPTVTPPTTDNDEATAEITDGATRDINEEDQTDDAQTDDEVEKQSAIQEASEEVTNSSTPPSVEAEELKDTKTADPEPAGITEEIENLPEEQPAAPKEDEVLFSAEYMPEFPGGINGMKRYFRKNYAYPRPAREAGVEGTVLVRFVVKEDGSLSDISILKGLGFGCDDEAMRLVRKMPKWIPGEHDGKRVKVYKTIPIGFKLYE